MICAAILGALVLVIVFGSSKRGDSPERERLWPDDGDAP